MKSCTFELGKGKGIVLMYLSTGKPFAEWFPNETTLRIFVAESEKVRIGLLPQEASHSNLLKMGAYITEYVCIARASSCTGGIMYEEVLYLREPSPYTFLSSEGVTKPLPSLGRVCKPSIVNLLHEAYTEVYKY